MKLISPEIAALDLDKFMQFAVNEAELAGQAGEIPIGAVIVIDGEIISRGRATHNEMRNQIRHAELNAILDGGEPLWKNYRRAILFTTVEPCPLCLGAVVMADIPHVIFGIHDEIVKSEVTIEHNLYVQRHIQSYFGGVLAEDVAKMMKKYDPESLHYIQSADHAFRPEIKGN